MEEKENVALDTVPKIFWNAVNTRKHKTAMREKDLGIWQSISWKEYGEKAKYIGLALNSLGLNKSDVVSIASEGIPEWLFTDLGVICVDIGARTTDLVIYFDGGIRDTATISIGGARITNDIAIIFSRNEHHHNLGLLF